MTQEIVKKTSTAIAIADDSDPFQAFADAVAPQHILGKLLKFSKGDWLAGESSEPVDHNASFVVGMHAMTTGWVRWREFKPVEHAMVSIGSRLLPPRRDDLGDNDSSTWETDDRGDKRDPWQFTSYVPMIADNDGEVFTFAASSKGGFGALGKLSRTYAARRRSAPGQLPVVTLGSGGYAHSHREYGYVKTPLFLVTGWTAASRFNETMALAGYDFPHGNESAPPETPTAPTAAVKRDDMDDDIPF
ncbi:hypothetical protein [Bradyrhizobium valentinum]|uniref:Uncharacterized protein n=1 Tax=Bradyrhizobium valentinum TaxID=1518501 RepID=A0A0R3KFB4_9BRAD|nr:hypothetical protein [Bradyrhizobium valentinum]KRQ94454.1 hypothetical protein CQ10_34000 [Bradyrhizobium valentinum]KRR10565.1 hypothetical protein CP49_12350 [Bradyrhizobium valentinum]